MALAPELVERFRADLVALGVPGEGKFGVAYSGGPDSLALMLLIHAAYPGQVKAATVDHGLRPESAGEAEIAAANCGKLAIPHETLAVEVAPGNIQAQARAARYGALSDWAGRKSVRFILTAHHADDQAETFLMRANRGSGLFGLAGVRPVSPIADGNVLVLRPLLSWSRRELTAIAADSGLEVVADPSNEDDRFDRVRMRKALAESDLIDVEGVAGSARLLAQAGDDFLGLVHEEWVAAVQGMPHERHYRPFARSALHRPVFWTEVVCLICEDMNLPVTRSDAAKMVESLSLGRSINIGGIQASRGGEGDDPVWIFAPENPRRGS